MADQLELQHGLLGRHGLDRELLRLDDDRLLLVGYDGPRLVLVLMVRAMPGDLLALTLLPVALHLTLQLLREHVDRRPHVVRALPGPEDRSFRPDRRLCH